MRARIASARNRQVVWARRLRQRKYRHAERRFLVEGLQLIHMGLEGGHRPELLFYCEELFAGPGAPAIWERCRAAGTTLVPVTAAVMATLSERDTCAGLLGVFPFVEREPRDLALPAGAALALLLDRLQNPGNLGTLIRTADAAGAAAVLVLEPGADLYDPTAVRATMGSLFSLPLVRGRDPAALLALVPAPDWQVLGADPHAGALWDLVDWPARLALVLGNEARGLSPDVRARVNSWVRLPMAGRAESLNVAVTGGILMYAWVGRAGGGSAAPRGTPDRAHCASGRS